MPLGRYPPNLMGIEKKWGMDFGGEYLIKKLID
jgi:hypothetical protein